MTPEDLYGLPLDRFVPERNALARSLRNDGQRAEADRVAALRKPSVAAWAVNQIVRTQTRAVQELFAAGDEVQRAQEDLLGGAGDARALRDAVEAVRASVEALVEASQGLLSSSGEELSPAVVDRVRETLNAAALDADARAEVHEGCLVRELTHAGLGAFATVSAPASSGRKRATRGDEGKAAAREQQAEGGAAAREQQADAKAAREAERAAQRALERAERALASAEERRDRAAEALREAEDEMEAARARRDQARDEARARRGAR